tara:strand:+ start:356 stop:958 length:603 start_codon:yes stop_codon:yes gene_type:complete
LKKKFKKVKPILPDSIRKQVFQFRDQLDNEQCLFKSAQILENFKNFFLLSELSKKKIACYRSMEKEVQTNRIHEYLRDCGASLYYPKIIDPYQKKMQFFSAEDWDVGFQDGYFGVKEPVSDELCHPDDLDLMIVPGVGFSKKMQRVGYGQGYYDRYLESLLEIKKIGLAFEFQVFESIKGNSWDQKMSIIISEERIYEGE